MSSVVVYQPMNLRSDKDLDQVRESLMAPRDVESRVKIDEDGFVVVTSPTIIGSRHAKRPALITGLVRSITDRTRIQRRIEAARLAREEEDATAFRTARIVAIIPTYETESRIDKSVESLLLQSRPLDEIVVVINGPGNSAEAFNRLKWLAVAFPKQLTIVRPDGVNGKDASGKSKGSKVGALNWAYRRFLAGGEFEFMLGMDADVVADENMVHHLEEDLLRQARAGGVRAKYSFEVPSHEEMKGKSLQLVYGQRREFTKKEIDDALNRSAAHILGGQATLFDVQALRDAARVTEGRVPWSDKTLVEDAELTRTLERLNYRPMVSTRARAWTGLMYTTNAWQKQRRKWQDGHLTDMTRDFRPRQDFRRWKEQIGLGWNLLLRVLFAVVVTMSLALDTLELTPLWVIPLGVVTLQSLLIALKTPKRSLREIVNALGYVPGEIYYLRTLSVWLDSVIVVILNISRDGWSNQAAAESAQKKTATSGWLIIIAAVATPIALLLVLERFIAPEVMARLVEYGWNIVTAMTAISVVTMLWFIVRVLRSWRTLNP
jgi:biofilm PGA synthesis N-glycosyltransferase PgaC